MLPHKQIELRLQAAVRQILPDVSDTEISTILIRPCPNPIYGDYQCSALLSLAKRKKIRPVDLTGDVIQYFNYNKFDDLCHYELAGAGFLNFRLKNPALAQTLEAAVRGEHLFFEKLSQPKTIVIDFSSPNVAKPMHVGHIRSTGIGDALQRTLRLLGHRVISDNHIGDWGTQFGMLIAAWKVFKLKKALQTIEGARSWTLDVLEVLSAFGEKEFSSQDVYQFESELQKKHPTNLHVKVKIRQQLQVLRDLGLVEEINERYKWKRRDSITELEAFYKLFQNESKEDPNLIPTAKLELVKLQSGDAENISIWKEMIELSQIQFDTIYSRLGVKFDFALGESFYNPWLGEVVDDLLAKKIARESEGAVGVFSDGSLPPKEDPFLVNRDGEWIDDPALVRKSDGGFNYTTTDLATVDYRLKTWSPQAIVYVVDDRQSGHFKKLFAIFARWKPDTVESTKLIHVGFGKILGDDGKPFKTRSGDTVKLGDLLDEAEVRAFKIVSEKSSDLSEAQRKEIARVVGIGAVKYADLLPNRQSDYVFSWDKMLALQGNTAPYLLYAYARIKSIFRKLEKPEARSQKPELKLAAPEEIALAKHLLNFGLTLEAVAEEYRPNFLCNYLFELAGKFTGFYENCPVLKAEGAVRESRLALCDLTARVLKQGLDVLGIETVEQM
jgi:arginyl-tRNA synthetase